MYTSVVLYYLLLSVDQGIKSPSVGWPAYYFVSRYQKLFHCHQSLCLPSVFCTAPVTLHYIMDF